MLCTVAATSIFICLLVEQTMHVLFSKCLIGMFTCNMMHHTDCQLMLCMVAVTSVSDCLLVRRTIHVFFPVAASAPSPLPLPQL